MINKLTTEERVLLEATLKMTKDSHEKDRLRVILGYDEGYPLQEIANILKISERSVYGYLEDYDREKKTANNPHEGRPCKLSEEQEVELKEYLSQITYTKAKDICAYVKDKYHIEYTEAGITAWLGRNGFVYKAPLKIPGKIDPKKQEAFIAEYEKLKSHLRDKEEIFFMDAVHPEYQSQATYGWILKGENKTLATTAKQKRVHFVGAIRLQGMKVLAREYETVDASSIIEFLKHLEKSTSASKIHLICDNSRAHRNKAVADYLNTSKKLQIHFLPPYSPNLNPIERLWKVLREKVTYNRTYKTFEDFGEEVRSFFSIKIRQMKSLLRRRITDNFQKIEVNILQTSI